MLVVVGGKIDLAELLRNIHLNSDVALPNSLFGTIRDNGIQTDMEIQNPVSRPKLAANARGRQKVLSGQNPGRLICFVWLWERSRHVLKENVGVHGIMQTA